MVHGETEILPDEVSSTVSFENSEAIHTLVFLKECLYLSNLVIVMTTLVSG